MGQKLRDKCDRDRQGTDSDKKTKATTKTKKTATKTKKTTTTKNRKKQRQRKKTVTKTKKINWKNMYRSSYIFLSLGPAWTPLIIDICFNLGSLVGNYYLETPLLVIFLKH